MFDFFFKKRELLPLPYKREIHCHIIPGVDDGAAHMEDSVAYLHALAQFGAEEVILTPHSIEGRFENNDGIIDPIFNELKEKAKSNGVNLSLSYSYEYRLDERFLLMLEAGEFGSAECRLRPLYDRYILIENSFAHPTHGIENLIYKLQSKGYYPILAHPERYLYYAGRKGIHYHRLQDTQVDFQCNLLSFAGYYGSVAKKMAYWLLEEGYVNFLATDLHNHTYVRTLESFLRSKEYAAIKSQLEDCARNDDMDN